MGYQPRTDAVKERVAGGQHHHLLRVTLAEPDQQFGDIGPQCKPFAVKLRELLQMPLAAHQRVRTGDRVPRRRRHQMQARRAHANHR